MKKKHIFKTQEQKQIESLAVENANLMFQNALQDGLISALQKENADLFFMIATGGGTPNV